MDFSQNQQSRTCRKWRVAPAWRKWPCPTRRTPEARAMSGAPDAPVKVEGKTFVHPTAVLFNGGAFKAAALKDRVIEVLNDWLAADGGPPAQEMGGAGTGLGA